MTTPTPLHERLLHEQAVIEGVDSEAHERDRTDRLQRLLQLRRSGLFVNSVWAYGSEGEETLQTASLLWTPSRLTVDSGRLAVIINEWRPVSQDDSRRIHGSGVLEEGGQILMGIFEHMASEGAVKLIANPSTPSSTMDSITASIVAREASIVLAPQRS